MSQNFEIIDTYRVKDVVVHTLKFSLPLNYNDSGSEKINVVANYVQSYDSSKDRSTTFSIKEDPNVIVFLQGGPGFPCNPHSVYTKFLLKKGFQILFVDQRGTGYSTPLEYESICKYGGSDPTDQLKFILNFRADSIVRDCEEIRKTLVGDKKWSIMGQSYGGFCCSTYLSFFPDSVKQAIITGGIPPIGLTPDDVYIATYKRTAERNIHYYKKYPQDIAKVFGIVKYLAANKVELPNGGILSVERFQQLGLNFGGSGGTDEIHRLVTKFSYDLENFSKPTYKILHDIQSAQRFDTNIIYALFQEAIYCEGSTKSNWAADRIRYEAGNENFNVLHLLKAARPDELVTCFFTGEMVYKSMFDDYVELAKLKDLAFLLHEHNDWSALYEVEQLKKISNNDQFNPHHGPVIPIVAATYYHDQYVDFELSMKAKNYIGGIRQYITSEYFHNGLSADPEGVLGHLFDLINDEID